MEDRRAVDRVPGDGDGEGVADVTIGQREVGHDTVGLRRGQRAGGEV